MTSYLYVISHPKGWRKIGHAKKPRTRLLQHQAHSGQRLLGECISPTVEPKKAEQRAHVALARNRIMGEWFDVTAQEASDAIAKATGSAVAAWPLAPKKPRKTMKLGKSKRSNEMVYGPYIARVEFDPEDEIFVGHIAGIRDVVGFHAETVQKLKDAFQEAVDDYAETCAKVGKQPQKPYSGKVMFRIDPDVHRLAAITAELHGVSLNQWAEGVLKQAVLEN